MPRLTPTKLFVKDLEQFRSNKVLRKKIAKALALMEANPLHPGLHLERIINDPLAWVEWGNLYPAIGSLLRF